MPIFSKDEVAQASVRLFDHLVNLDIFTADFGDTEPDADTLEKYREACEMIAGVVLDSLEIEIPENQPDHGGLAIIVHPKDEDALANWLLLYSAGEEVAQNLD